MQIDYFRNKFRDIILDSCSGGVFNYDQINSQNWKETYHSNVNKLRNAPAVYVFHINNFSEIIYIGMAGKFKNKGVDTNWYVRNRLKAYRGKSLDGNYIQTHEFIKRICIDEKINMVSYEDIFFEKIVTFEITVYYPKVDVLASYLEAAFINDFFQKNQSLPKLNLAY